MPQRVLFVSLFSLLAAIGGCASQQLGTAATLTDSSQYLPMTVSAAFQPTICSGYFGYLTFSLANQSSEWLRFHEARVSFPGMPGEDAIRVIAGDDLQAWQDSRVLMLNREQYNQAVANLVVTAAGLAMLLSDDKGLQTAGAGALIVSEAARTDNKVREQYRDARQPISLEPEKHLLNAEISIPPLMDRQYWLLLNNQADAPLLTDILLTLKGQDGTDYEYRVPLANWESCGWQAERKDTLEQWGRKAGYTTRSFDRESGTMKQRVTKSLPELERLYQEQQAETRQVLAE